jgi:sarcosine oxidase subunit alpha
VNLDKGDFAGRPELLWQHEDGTGPRLVGLQPVDGSVVPPEASQIVANGRILGRITSSRMSPTLNRSVCLAQIDAAHATAGTEVTVQLPDGRPITARVTAQPAHLDPEGRRLRHRSDAPAAPEYDGGSPVARSAVTLPATGAGSEPGVTLADAGPLAALTVRAPSEGAVGTMLGTGFGRAVRNVHGDLVVGSGPGEWLVLAEPGALDALHTRLEELASSGEFVTVVDLTHGRALLRLRGERSADLLATVCAIDLADDAVPDGAALRTSIGTIVTDIVRDDQGAAPSYLLHCERSSGQYLAEVLLDAGARPILSSER